MDEPDAADRMGPTKGCDLSLVLACYQEEGHLAESVRQIRETLRSTRLDYELIFIDDKSRDNTAEVVRVLCAGDPRSRAIYHDQNVGRGGTVTEGFRAARGRVVGFIDVDLEVHCRYIPAMVEAIARGADGAVARRFYKVRMHPVKLLRHILSRGYRVLFRLAFRVPYRDSEAGYKFFRRDRVLPVLDECQDPGWFWDSEVMVLSHMHGLKLVEIPCLFEQRSDKVSTVRIGRDVWAYLRALVRFKRRLRRRPIAAAAVAASARRRA